MEGIEIGKNKLVMLYKLHRTYILVNKPKSS